MQSYFSARTLVLLILFDLMLWSPSFSQTKVESTGQKNRLDISNYLSILDEKARLVKENPSGKGADSVFRSMSMGELKNAASLMFKASDVDAVAIHDSLTARSDRFMQEYAKGIKGGIKPGLVQVKILNEVKKQISPAVYALLRFAYLLKVRVTKVDVVPGGLSLMPNAKRTVVTASVLQVYKGSGKLKPGDEIQFYYFDLWLNHPVAFKKGHEYLTPLEYDMALYAGLDRSDAYYPIENGELTDAYNLFGFGERLEFTTFEAKLDSLITEVKSW